LQDATNHQTVSGLLRSLYSITLLAHSYVRWAVLVAAVTVVARCAASRSREAPWTPRDESAHKTSIALADAQLALGILLWAWLSPITAAFFADPRHAVHDRVLRFFGLEHVTMMALAVAVLHAGRRWSKRAEIAQARRRRVLFSSAAFIALVVTSIPWPGLRHGRPLFRTELAQSPGEERAPICPSLYGQRCVTCHGLRGAADGIAGASLHPSPRNFTDPTWQARTSDTRIRDVIKDGGFAHGLSAAMPAQPDLTPADLQALTACIRSFGRK
jgi:mono/diheme cytochrome c family protein